MANQFGYMSSYAPTRPTPLTQAASKDPYGLAPNNRSGPLGIGSSNGFAAPAPSLVSEHGLGGGYTTPAQHQSAPVPAVNPRSPLEQGAPQPSAARRGYGARWQRIRARYLAAHPFCTEPGCELDATDVDHVDGRGPSGDNTDANLRGYCHSHHSTKTALHDGGFGRARREFPNV